MEVKYLPEGRLLLRVVVTDAEGATATGFHFAEVAPCADYDWVLAETKAVYERYWQAWNEDDGDSRNQLPSTAGLSVSSDILPDILCVGSIIVAIYLR